MGKQQTKKKTQRWRHNPIRVPDDHLGGGSGVGKVEAGKEKQMLPILQKVGRGIIQLTGSVPQPIQAHLRVTAKVTGNMADVCSLSLPRTLTGPGPVRRSATWYRTMQPREGYSKVGM